MTTSHIEFAGLGPNYKGRWKEEDFTNFWEHYNISQKWIGIEAKAREEAWKHWDGRLNNEAPHNRKKMQENLSDDNISDVSPEMVDFLRKTIDHRKQRDEQRKRLETVLANSRNKGLEYRDATTVGRLGSGNIRSSNRSNLVQRDNQKKTLYGEPAFLKLREQELSIQENFDKQVKENRPQTWPNIPMRF
ncbi:hypothetical protein ACQ4LE_005464 [Meloidogyne hapla]|uniref:Uncharacterized protein n=1 Tax=Meloidogyne hapla TaxID=6305 RepID=A0A1I8BPK1_MELHA